MKTPRELLLDRQRQAQSNLDVIRRETLAGMNKVQPERATISLRDIFHSLRWHLTGMGAIWIFVVFLHLDTGRPSQAMASNPPAKTSSPQFIMVSVRENRRQLAEMIDSLPAENSRRELFRPKPRSERRREMVMA
jgi:hypothetical protein